MTYGLFQCIQQVDGTVLPELIPRLTDLIKSSIGLGTKVGIATVINSLCLQCGLETMQPFAGNQSERCYLHFLLERSLNLLMRNEKPDNKVTSCNSLGKTTYLLMILQVAGNYFPETSCFP